MRSEQLHIDKLYLVTFTVKVGSYVSGDTALSVDIRLAIRVEHVEKNIFML